MGAPADQGEFIGVRGDVGLGDFEEVFHDLFEMGEGLLFPLRGHDQGVSAVGLFITTQAELIFSAAERIEVYGGEPFGLMMVAADHGLGQFDDFALFLREDGHFILTFKDRRMSRPQADPSGSISALLKDHRQDVTGRALAAGIAGDDDVFHLNPARLVDERYEIIIEEIDDLPAAHLTGGIIIAAFDDIIPYRTASFGLGPL